MTSVLEKRPGWLPASLGRDFIASLVVFLVAWRYGYIPPGEKYSVTELEYRAARDAGKACLVFMVGKDTPWPRIFADNDETNIRGFREQLRKQHVVGYHDRRAPGRSGDPRLDVVSAPPVAGRTGGAAPAVRRLRLRRGDLEVAGGGGAAIQF